VKTPATWLAFAAILGASFAGPHARAQSSTAPSAPQSPSAQSAQPAPTAQAQSQPQSQQAPLYSVTVVARTTKAINYRHLSAPTRIDFQGTVLLPLAKGEGTIETKKSAIRIQAKFEKLEPAARFGPEFLTYVLWAVSPEGRADNLGEIALEGSGTNLKSKLDVTAQLQAFALIVTAEPYFAVTQPSEVVVVENIVRPDTTGTIEEIDAKFDLLQRSQYTYVQANAQPITDTRTPLALREARNAVQIAKSANAEKYANASLQKAVQLLAQAEESEAHKADRKSLEMAARECVQTAEDARAIATKRAEEERLAAERAAAAESEAKAKAQAADAERARLEAQLAAERAGRERAEAEAARAAAVAQQQALAAEAERQRIAAEQAARQKAEADAARVAADAARAAALAQEQAAQAEAERQRQAAVQAAREREQAQADADMAQLAASRAEAEKADLRAQLLAQLNSILQTRDTARGLIVNMSDVLFDTGSYTLKAGAREKLAKISGIMLAHPGLQMQIEGHTDAVGTDDFNQQLSERRAGMVRDFLIDQGVAASTITARGFGKTQPVASNDTSEGRQRNRRVELVVNGDSIATVNATAGSAARPTSQ
jgi:outer membrane protein OmpA-like peptidoglycan-associated protein